MKARYAVLAMAATLLIGCAKAEEPATTEEASTDVNPGASAEHVRAAVQKHFDAVGTGNAAVIDSLSTADLVHVDATGDVHTEQQLMEKYRGAPVKYTAEKIDVRVFGDVAVVNARVVDSGNKKLHVTQVWVLRHAGTMAANRAPASKRSATLVSRKTVLAQYVADSSEIYEMVSMHTSAMSAMAASAMSSGAAADVAADAAAAEAAMNKPAN